MLDIIFACIVVFFHYNSIHFCAYCKGRMPEIISFVAGVSTTYLFLSLIPKFVYAIEPNQDWMFIPILAGFIAVHLTEKYIYKLTPDKLQIRMRLQTEDAVVSFFYHLMLGIVLGRFAQDGLVKGILLFIPVLFHTAVRTLPVGHETKSVPVRLFLASAILFGVLINRIVNFSETGFLMLLGLAIGFLTFMIIRHAIPFGRKGKPHFYISGVIIYCIIILLTQNFNLY